MSTLDTSERSLSLEEHEAIQAALRKVARVQDALWELKQALWNECALCLYYPHCESGCPLYIEGNACGSPGSLMQQMRYHQGEIGSLLIRIKLCLRARLGEGERRG